MVTQRIERITQGWVMQGREEGREEGRKEGEKKGRDKGRKEGRIALLQRLLEFKFGQLPPFVMDRLKQADVDHLETWGERVLTARSLDEVFAD